MKVLSHVPLAILSVGWEEGDIHLSVQTRSHCLELFSTLNKCYKTQIYLHEKNIKKFPTTRRCWLLLGVDGKTLMFCLGEQQSLSRACVAGICWISSGESWWTATVGSPKPGTMSVLVVLKRELSHCHGFYQPSLTLSRGYLRGNPNNGSSPCAEENKRLTWPTRSIQSHFHASQRLKGFSSSVLTN